MKNFFKDIASEEKEKIDYNLVSKQIFIPPRRFLSFLNEDKDLYDIWPDLLLDYLNFNDIKSQQLNFLKDLMSGFKVYKKIKKLKNE